MLVAVQWWPPDVPFDMEDMATVAKVLKEQQAERRR
jgi:hypothetical protein